jgi:hypothetical protein
MHFEIHITVETNDIRQFCEDCKKLGVKPIVIETQKRNGFGIQVMTSSKYSDDHYQRELDLLVRTLTEMKYVILRRKVEIQPESFQKNPEFIYYECHIKLMLPRNMNREAVRDVVTHRGWYWSRNIFKYEVDMDIQMITLRRPSMRYQEFITVVDNMKMSLDNMNVHYGKIEIEECVFDSNQRIDEDWMTAYFRQTSMLM